MTKKLVRLQILALPDALGSSLTLPGEMFAAANQVLRARRSNTEIELQMVGLGRRGQQIALSGRLHAALDHHIDRSEIANMVLVPTVWRFNAKRQQWPLQYLDWLRRQYANNAIVVAVGTGSYLLAEAGLLDGKLATTHWHYLDDFKQRYPAVRTRHQNLITEDERIYCAGSVNSVADLSIHLIERRWGKRIARRVEQQFSPEVRQTWQRPTFRSGIEHGHGDELITEIQSRLNHGLDQSHPIAELSKQSGISGRSLQRRFKQATGQSIQQYLQEKRIEEARSLLAETDLSIAEVGQWVGFDDPTYFNRVFRQAMQQAPGEYRRSVRGKLFSPA